MKCWRIDLRRSISRYLDETIAPGAVKRLEDHLLDCRGCRTKLARLRAGHRYAMQMPAFRPSRNPWLGIESAIQRAETERPASASQKQGLRCNPKAFSPRILAAWLLFLAFVAPVVYFGAKSFGARSSSWNEPSIDRDEFHAVGIADIEHNTEPHVVAEGYVAEVRVNDEDGDLSFKLVENLQQAEPFIVCEIIDPIKLSPPPVGSKVRVYGVSRYDGKVDHQWYEVHPVLGIEMVRRRD